MNAKSILTFSLFTVLIFFFSDLVILLFKSESSLSLAEPFVNPSTTEPLLLFNESNYVVDLLLFNSPHGFLSFLKLARNYIADSNTRMMSIT